MQFMKKIKKLKVGVISKIGKSFLFPKELRINKNGQNSNIFHSI